MRTIPSAPLAIWLLSSALATSAIACSAASDGGGGKGDAGGNPSGASPPPPSNGATSSGDDDATGAPGPTTDDGGTSGSVGAGAGDASSNADGAAPAPTTRVVAYLPNYNGSYADWAKSIDFAKVTHLNLAFAVADASNGWSMGASDGDVTAIVTAAHAAGVRVLASLGGGGGDQSVISQFKDAGNVPALVSHLDAFVTAHGFDGVDVDIEDPSHLGSDYAAFVAAVIEDLRPKGKLVTAAVAQYLQDSMSDATLHSFDFVNVMIYSSYADSVSAMTYYAGTKKVPASQLTLGAGFFGSDSDGNEVDYSAILAADPGAWAYDQTQVNGKTVSYTGVASMKKLADYSKGFGGIMVWELTEDTTDTHSLFKVIQGEM